MMNPLPMEGLDAETEAEVEIEGLDTIICRTIIIEEKKKTRSGSFEYELINMPKEINVGEKFDLTVRLDNNDASPSDIKIWSYVFRGPKSYSGEREENKKEFVLKGRSSDIIELSNLIPEAEPGDYRLKIVINKDGQKTNKEITEDIRITDEKINLESDFVDSEILEKGRITANLITSDGVVYESTTEKAKKLILTFTLILSVFINIVLFWRR